jgi:hypothetical protein
MVPRPDRWSAAAVEANAIFVIGKASIEAVETAEFWQFGAR